MLMAMVGLPNRTKGAPQSFTMLKHHFKSPHHISYIQA